VRYLAVAFDYDGTLAHDGRVADSTVEALERAARSGRRLLLVTGRELDDLKRVFSRLDLFDRVVAENGGLLYRPDSREQVPLGPPPPPELVARLRERHVEPLGVGEVIIATRQPHDVTVLEAIRELGLELQVIFNKGAVMVLPAGVSKASGLAAALDELRLSRHNVLGVGDAENDHAFLTMCECSVAVANALPALKERCDVVTKGSRGEGIEEIIDRVIESDLADLGDGPARHHILLGHREGKEVRLPPYGTRLIVAGTSGSGKSTVTSALVERLVEADYQVCLVDPEGDHDDGVGGSSVVIGDADATPSVQEIVGLLERPSQTAVVNLLAIPIPDRQGFFEHLLPQITTLSTRYGRPHWLVVDEAHHLLPRAMAAKAADLLQQLGALMLITVHPEAVNPAVLKGLNTVIAVGGEQASVIEAVAKTAALQVAYGRRMTPDPNLPSIYPVLRYDDATKAIRFLTEAFGLTEHFVTPGPDGAIGHAELAWGNGLVMLSSGSVGSSAFALGPVCLYLAVSDPDAHHDRAVAAGAEIVMELTDQDYGSREYAAGDPEGNVWCFGTYQPGPAKQ